MTESAFEYALQRWGGAAEFRQAAGLDGRLPARGASDDGGRSSGGPRPVAAPEPSR